MLPARFALLLLCLMLPLQGLAQTSPPEMEQAPSVTPPPLVPAPPEPQAPADSPRHGSNEEGQGELIPREWPVAKAPSPTAPRLLVEFLGGSLGGTLGVIPGGIIFLSNLCIDSCSNGSESGALLGLGLAFAGVAVGTGAGVYTAGGLMGGHGRFLPTAAGAALGTLAGVLVGGALAEDGGEASLLAVLLSPVLGGIIGYESSNSPPVPQRYASRAPRPQVVPLVTATPGGGFIGGLAGRF
ncbi:MAG: hypothetical protein JXB05_35390 [Myxococcaceae bacterium]|nr:hypothetical protein [Myxococcaceae bacterium]